MANRKSADGSGSRRSAGGVGSRRCAALRHCWRRCTVPKPRRGKVRISRRDSVVRDSPNVGARCVFSPRRVSSRVENGSVIILFPKPLTDSLISFERGRPTMRGFDADGQSADRPAAVPTLWRNDRRARGAPVRVSPPVVRLSPVLVHLVCRRPSRPRRPDAALILVLVCRDLRGVRLEPRLDVVRDELRATSPRLAILEHDRLFVRADAAHGR